MKDKILKGVNNCISLIVYLLIGVGCGWYAGDVKGQIAGFPIVGLLLLFSCILVHLLIHIVLHETGHLLAGLMTGYEFVSFRLGSLIWIKGADGKVHLKKMKLQGTGGQCLMAPPSLPAEKCPYKLYHLGGGLVNIILGVIALVLFGFVVPKGVISFALLGEFGLVGIMSAAMQLIPMKTNGIQNDGYNLIDLGKDPQAKECMNLCLEVYARLSIVEDISELPEDLMDRLMSIDLMKMDVKNSTVANVLSFQLQFYLYEGNHEKVKDLGNYLVETPEVIELFKNETRCELLYIAILEGNSEEIEKLYDKKLQEYVKVTESYPSRQRLLYAYYHLYKKDEDKANEMYEKLMKSVETHSIKAEAMEELKIVEKLKNMSAVYEEQEEYLEKEAISE